jgi:hypothetical protein
MTMLLTPLNSTPIPYPAEVQYGWRLRPQRTRMFWSAGSPIAHEDVLMLATRGYSVTHQRAGLVQCLAALPGTPRPNWISEAPCACEAVIKGTTSLTPVRQRSDLQLPATKPRVFWTWHTFDGRMYSQNLVPDVAHKVGCQLARKVAHRDFIAVGGTASTLCSGSCSARLRRYSWSDIPPGRCSNGRA